VQQESGITAIAHAIQLSVAPVFLLSGVAAILAVMTNRLGRIIDRARVLESQLRGVVPEAMAPLHRELGSLSRRAKLMNRSITLCTITALLICAVIVTGFLGVVFLRVDISMPMALLFVTAMVSFFAGLVLFLREIFVATASLRIGPH
jgi:hypothetical protein